jgi:hypothetical protein
LFGFFRLYLSFLVRVVLLLFVLRHLCSGFRCVAGTTVMDFGLRCKVLNSRGRSEDVEI